MLSGNLDFSASRAHILNARQKVESLQREVAEVQESSAYTVRVGQVDEDGWCVVWLIPPTDICHYGLGITFGETMVSLRSALDYIVVELARACGAKPSPKHQFPIFEDPKKYADEVSRPPAVNEKGRLAGIDSRIAIEMIEGFQPYHQRPEPRLHPLWLVNHFSNAYKHREVGEFLQLPYSWVMQPESVSGQVIDVRHTGDISRWAPDQEYEIGQVRFAPPFPAKPSVEVDLCVRIGFGAHLVDWERPGYVLEVEHQLPELVKTISKIPDMFEQAIKRDHEITCSMFLGMRSELGRATSN